MHRIFKKIKFYKVCSNELLSRSTSKVNILKICGKLCTVIKKKKKAQHNVMQNTKDVLMND